MQTAELIDSAAFYPPVEHTRIGSLLSEFNYKKSKIKSFSDDLIKNMNEVAGYFGKYHGKKNNGNYPPSLSYLLEKEGAIKSLEAEYWNKVIELTGVMEIMPEKRRNELHEQIRNLDTIEFNRDNIQSTVIDLLSSRERFFAERVDGVFKALSGSHVTNQPEGFSKRMIIDYVHNLNCDKWRPTNHAKLGFLHDLRIIVRKFAGLQDDIDKTIIGATEDFIYTAYRVTGQWISIDGGHIRLRVYKKGTAHVEISPDMAWKLNTVLSYLYPAAIPPKFRQKPKKQHKDFKLMNKPLASDVITELAKSRLYTHSIEIKSYSIDKTTQQELHSALMQIGGVITQKPSDKNYKYTFSFDYPVIEVIEEIIKTGEIPNHKSYQFYPTPQTIAEEAVYLADIKEDSLCLEPSAGIGGIADLMPKDRTTCIEISELHSKILQSKGFKVITGDFIKLASETNKRFDRIVMNPPYSEGRWKAHIEEASKLLNKDGKLIAILPSSTKDKELIKGFKHTYSKIYKDEFSGTSIDTVIVTIE